ncbi:MAG TPA: hypothetical protein VGR14_22415 [Verrucomicrobiae bacterium]|nr:hypothetical protein [Verrucomicrobiae bacterium]
MNPAGAAGGSGHKPARKEPMQVITKDGHLVISVPLQTPTPSKSSGKTLVVATTHGNTKTELELPGHPGKKVIIGLNAYIPR